MNNRAWHADDITGLVFGWLVGLVGYIFWAGGKGRERKGKGRGNGMNENSPGGQ